VTTRIWRIYKIPFLMSSGFLFSCCMYPMEERRKEIKKLIAT